MNNLAFKGATIDQENVYRMVYLQGRIAILEDLADERWEKINFSSPADFIRKSDQQKISDKIDSPSRTVNYIITTTPYLRRPYKQKISDIEAIDIRRLRHKVTAQELADKYNIKRTTVYSIWAGRRRKYLAQL